MTWIDAWAAAPLMTVAGLAVVVLLLAVAPGADGAEVGGTHLAWATLLGLGAALALLLAGGGPAAEAFSGTLARDGAAAGFGAVVLGAAAVTAVLGVAYLRDQRLAAGEFFALVLLATAGMLLVAMAQDLLVLFLGVEVMSLAAYVLAGYRHGTQRSAEAALKYFVFGAFASAFLLMGIALVFGEVGAHSGTPGFRLAEVQAAFAAAPGPLGLLGAGLVLLGLAFKVAAVPFHMWAPDVYQGAPTPVAGFMAVGIKAAAFAGLCRVVAAFCPVGAAHVPRLLSALEVLAAVTMAVGNLLALRQSQVKRMLAYSSVGHAGYLLLGVLAMAAVPQGQGRANILVYLGTYGAMTLGAFAVVTAWERHGERSGGLSVEGLAGAAHRQPLLGLAMTLFLAALAGLPPTGGFVAKAGLFLAAIEAGHAGVVLFAALCSVVGAAAYLRVMVAMWSPRGHGATASLASPWLAAALAACALVALGAGVAPELPARAARQLLSAAS